MTNIAPPTNTNFRNTFLLTTHQYKLPDKFSNNLTSGSSLCRLTCIKRTLPSDFCSHFHGRSLFLVIAKNYCLLRFIHNNNNKNNNHFHHQLLLMGVFCTEVIATSLIPLDTILPEKCAFIIGFNCTVWIKMRSLTGSLAGGVLADTILILS